jgi:hypothetical protein
MENAGYHRKASRQNMKEEDILTQTTFERQIIIKEHGSHTIIPKPSQRLPETGSFLQTMTTFSRIIIKFQRTDPQQNSSIMFCDTKITHFS